MEKIHKGSEFGCCDFLRFFTKYLLSPIPSSSSPSSSSSSSRPDGLPKGSGKTGKEARFTTTMADPYLRQVDKAASIPSTPLLLLPPTQAAAMVTGADHTRYYYYLNPVNNGIIRHPKKTISPWEKEPLLPDDAPWIGSSHGWVAFIHPRTQALLLVNPLSPPSSPSSIIHLPPVETLPQMLSRFITWSTTDDDDGSDCGSFPAAIEFTAPDSDGPISPQELMADFIIYKIKLSASPLHAVGDDGEIRNNEDCMVIIIYLFENASDLAFCRPGDTFWTTLTRGSGRDYDDVVYSPKDRLFYALHGGRQLEAWELSDISCPKQHLIGYLDFEKPRKSEIELEELMKNCSTEREDYLVVSSSSGDLLLVKRYIETDGDEDDAIREKTILYEVFKLDLARQKWVFTESIGDEVLFLGGNENSMSFSALEFPELTKNSIYFSDSDWGFIFEIDDIGIYELGNKNVTHFYPEKQKRYKPFPIWIHPNLC